MNQPLGVARPTGSDGQRHAEPAAGHRTRTRCGAGPHTAPDATRPAVPGRVGGPAFVGTDGPSLWEDPSVSQWSWRESNPRPSRGHRPRYDHSRTVALRLPPCRVKWARGPAAGSFPDVSGLSHRQRSLPAVLHRFCCRAAMDWPRVPSLVAMCLGYLIRSGSESEVVVGLCLGAPF